MKKSVLDDVRQTYSDAIEIQKPESDMIKKLEEEIANDPRVIRLKKLKNIQEELVLLDDTDWSNHEKAMFQAWMAWACKNKEELTDLYVRFGPMDDQSGKAFSSDVNDMIKTSSLYKYENVENPNRFFLISDEQKAEFERNHHVIYADKQGAGYLDYIFDFIEKCLTMSPEEAAQSMVNEYNNGDGQSRTRNDQ